MSGLLLPRKRIVSALNAGPPLRLAMLFGSGARGTDRSDSDVDIGIAPLDPDLPLVAELDLQSRLSEICGREVDLIRLDRAPCLVRWQVVRHGQVLFEAGPFEAARFIAGAASDYLDFEPGFARAAALFQERLAGRARGPDGVTDRDVVLRKLTSIRQHVARMGRRRAVDLAVFKADVDRQDALGMSFLVAVQDALDVALHIAADEGWGVPASYAESFGLLAARGAIEASLAVDLARMANLRNRLAHGYATVDVERIWREIPAGITALEGFTSAIGDWLARQT
jgi:uncharacterized protein YutE (UPF0331/DUF86 family)/predicted nucleotidyltransferase